VNVATPDALVDCVVVPPSVPDGLSDNVTPTPAVVTGLLFASSNCTEMVGRVEPDTTDAGMVEVIESNDPEPDTTSNAAVDALVSPVELAVRTYPLPDRLRVRLPNVTSPFAAVTVVVPPSVALPGPAVRATVTEAFDRCRS
jgi:hypothetical protein